MTLSVLARPVSAQEFPSATYTGTEPEATQSADALGSEDAGHLDRVALTCLAEYYGVHEGHHLAEMLRTATA